DPDRAIHRKQACQNRDGNQHCGRHGEAYQIVLGDSVEQRPDLNRSPLCNSWRSWKRVNLGTRKRGFTQYGSAGETQEQNGSQGCDRDPSPSPSHRHAKTYGFTAIYVRIESYRSPMNIDWIRKYCLSLPHSTETVQWSDDLVFKIAGKMYAVAALEP